MTSAHTLSPGHPQPPPPPAAQEPPTSPTFPHGTHEGLATAPSRMPSAGQGLYGIRPHPDSVHLFAKKGQFICTYATQRHQIPAQLARASQSRYLWSTNASNKHNTKALYVDAENAPHYGKYINDMWNTHANNCELRWNPATGKVEVYALRDILLNEELGTDYGAPFWYQAHNGLTTRAQAYKVQDHYNRSKLPWFADQRQSSEPPTSTSHNPAQTIPPTPSPPTTVDSHPPGSPDNRSSPAY